MTTEDAVTKTLDKIKVNRTPGTDCIAQSFKRSKIFYKMNEFQEKIYYFFFLFFSSGELSISVMKKDILRNTDYSASYVYQNTTETE